MLPLNQNMAPTGTGCGPSKDFHLIIVDLESLPNEYAQHMMEPEVPRYDRPL